MTPHATIEIEPLEGIELDDNGMPKNVDPYQMRQLLELRAIRSLLAMQGVLLAKIAAGDHLEAFEGLANVIGDMVQMPEKVIESLKAQKQAQNELDRVMKEHYNPRDPANVKPKEEG